MRLVRLRPSRSLGAGFSSVGRSPGDDGVGSWHGRETGVRRADWKVFWDEV